MWPQEFIWFFAIFYQEFRQGNGIAFAVLMMLAFAHFFGFYNPKQLADFLGIPHQKLSVQLKKIGAAITSKKTCSHGYRGNVPPAARLHHPGAGPTKHASDWKAAYFPTNRCVVV